MHIGTSAPNNAALSPACTCMYPITAFTYCFPASVKLLHNFLIRCPSTATTQTYPDTISSNSSTCRQKRKRLLDQHRFVWKGNPARANFVRTYVCSLSLVTWCMSFHWFIITPILIRVYSSYEVGGPWHATDHLVCGQFDEAFVEALKGT